MIVQSNEFTCELCGETYEKGWTDAEMWDEAEEMFGDEVLAERETAIICDDCWGKNLN